MTSTGTAPITLSGQGAGDNAGIESLVNLLVGGPTAAGDITVLATNTSKTGDSIKLTGVTIEGTGQLILAPLAAADSIGLAGGGGLFNLDTTELGFIQNGRPAELRAAPVAHHLASDSAVRRRMHDIPATYVIFDLLYLDGHSTLSLSYEERRELLERLELEGPAWRMPTYHRGEGKALLAATRELGIEGIVAKKLDCPYQPGARASHWIKVKNVHTQDVVIGGRMLGEGGRSSSLGSLAVGVMEGEQLVYAGSVAHSTLRRPGCPPAHDDPGDYAHPRPADLYARSTLALTYEERAASCSSDLELEGRAWRMPRTTVARAGALLRDSGAGDRGRRRQEARLPLPAGRARLPLDQGEERAHPGRRGRRLDPRRGRAQRAASARSPSA